MLKVISYIIILLVFFSCNQSVESKVSTTIEKKDTLDYNYTLFKANSQFFVGNENGVDTSYFKMSYPLFAPERLNDELKKYILIEGQNSPEEAAQAFIDGFDDFAGDIHTKNINAAWTKEIQSHVLLNTPILLTLVTQLNEYSGGAHGQHNTFYFNYDLENKDLIRLEDIIQKDKLKQLTQIAEQHFRLQENLAAEDTLTKDFFFEDGIFAINDNFGLSKKSLIIFFNEYEIRPYSEGPTRIEIPYEELTGILNIRGHQFIKSIL